MKELFEKDAPRQVCFLAASVPPSAWMAPLVALAVLKSRQSPATTSALKRTLCCTAAAAMEE